LYWTRIGAMQGHGSKLMASARFKCEWEPLSNSKMESELTKMTEMFEDLPYGPYKVAVRMFGRQRALQLAAQQLCIAPPSESNNIQQVKATMENMRGKKRRREDDDEGDREEFHIHSDDEMETD